jgi:hypothetical protein
MRTAAACLLLAPLSLAARADLITVLAAEQLIVNHNDVLIAGFTPEVVIASRDSLLHNALRFAFEPSGGEVSALVSGNDLPLFAPEPFDTLALCLHSGLNQLGTTMDSGRGWRMPEFDLDSGFVDPAAMGQYGTDGTPDIDITTIPDGGSGYVGYATSDLTMFGYMQIQRLSLYEWRLVGYRYDDSGAPVLVENLIPTPTTLAALSLLTLPRKRRRASGATSSRHAS